MPCRLRLGQRVRLSSAGFDVLPKLSKDEMREALGELTICYIGDEVYPGAFDVSVEGLLGKYLLCSDDFEAVK